MSGYKLGDNWEAQLWDYRHIEAFIADGNSVNGDIEQLREENEKLRKMVLTYTNQKAVGEVTESNGAQGVKLYEHAELQEGELIYALPTTSVIAKAAVALSARVVELEDEVKRLQSIIDDMVPLSADGKSVFIDGIGLVPLEHSGDKASDRKAVDTFKHCPKCDHKCERITEAEALSFLQSFFAWNNGAYPKDIIKSWWEYKGRALLAKLKEKSINA